MFETGAEAKKPVKKRVIRILDKSFEAPVAKEKHAPMKYGGKTASLLPYISPIRDSISHEESGYTPVGWALLLLDEWNLTEWCPKQRTKSESGLY